MEEIILWKSLDFCSDHFVSTLTSGKVSKIAVFLIGHYRH